MRRMKRESFDDVFERMQNLFDEFQDVGKSMTRGAIPVDIQEEDGRIIVKADLPGVTKEDISLKADDKSLEIAAESSEEIKEENEKYLRRERSSRSYRRNLRWPKRIDPESVEAEYSDGVLTVTAEKEENDGVDVDIE